MHETCMKHVCLLRTHKSYVHGTCMLCACFMHGTCMLCACFMHGMRMFHACNMHVIACMLHACHNMRMHVVRMLSACNMHVKRPKSLHVTWNMHVCQKTCVKDASWNVLFFACNMHVTCATFRVGLIHNYYKQLLFIKHLLGVKHPFPSRGDRDIGT